MTLRTDIVNFVREINLQDGDSTSLSKQEYNQLSEYLSGNKELTNDETKYIKGYMKKFTTKAERKKIELDNRIEDKKKHHYSLNELQKELGKNSVLLNTDENGITLLEKLNLITKNSDGSFNISNLSDFLQQILPEKTLNRYFSSDKAEDEDKDDAIKIKSLLYDKAYEQGVNDFYLKNNDIKKLAKLCGLETKTHIKVEFIFSAGTTVQLGDYGINIVKEDSLLEDPKSESSKLTDNDNDEDEKFI